MASSSISFHPRPLAFPFYPSSTPSNSKLFRIKFPCCRALKPTCCLSVHRSNDSKTDGNKTNDDDALRVVFAAGGTGGHIYPAVAIADELKIINPTTQILFIGSRNSMESTSVPSAGFDFVSLPTTVPLFRPILLSPQNVLLPYRLIKSLIQCHSIIKNFNPHIVVGTGGYVSFPTCLSAALQGIKVVIQEQNSVPGIANWVLSFFALKVFLAFNSTIECFPRKDKCVVCGNPVRFSLRTYVSKLVARLNFFPRFKKEEDAEARLLLVLGGSLGANAVNIAVLNLYYQMLMEKHNLFIIWQTGIQAFNEMESVVRNHPRLLLTPQFSYKKLFAYCTQEKRFTLDETAVDLMKVAKALAKVDVQLMNWFLHSMDLAYAAADLVVSRAGAMTCSEILATGKPAILIPSPNVAEGHQFQNASLMADVAGSRVITEDELDSITLGATIEEILGDEDLTAEMSDRALKAAKPGASAEIAQHILSLVESSITKKSNKI